MQNTHAVPGFVPWDCGNRNSTQIVIGLHVYCTIAVIATTMELPRIKMEHIRTKQPQIGPNIRGAELFSAMKNGAQLHICTPSRIHHGAGQSGEIIKISAHHQEFLAVEEQTVFLSSTALIGISCRI